MNFENEIIFDNGVFKPILKYENSENIGLDDFVKVFEIVKEVLKSKGSTKEIDPRTDQKIVTDFWC